MLRYLIAFFLVAITTNSYAQKEKFNDGWTFRVDTSNQLNEAAAWQKLPVPVRLPHDWSIEQPFDKLSPGGNRGASLRGGFGIYEKRFTLNESDSNKKIFIIFDGVYMNSTVIINDQVLGTRPFGYISFEYDLTPFLKFNGQENKLVVTVENKQPNSRWYSGSGIYRNVWLDKRGKIYVKYSGTHVTTPVISKNRAEVKMTTTVVADASLKNVSLKTSVYDKNNKLVTSQTEKLDSKTGDKNINSEFSITNPVLWDTGNPYIYTVVSEVIQDGSVIHSYTTPFGIRSFRFDRDNGFFLNGRHLKIIGACMHHDLGALGAAVNVSAMRRQLILLKSMGINAIRTSHNPPDPEWLDLCDEMGMLVMDETFDVWTWDKENTPYNYNLYFKEWHERDLTDHILRDRNHPSVIMWSVGNEIPEQEGKGADTIGRVINRQLVKIVKRYDTTRPVTAGLNYAANDNNLYLSGALDVIGVNYHHQNWKDLGTALFPGNQPYILSEAVSALATRGMYDMPSDSIRRWAGFTDQHPGGNPDFTMSSYENASAPWASTNEEALKIFLKYPYLSGMFIWTGMDYLGEPTPYPFPARSSYFGIIDMAGFPKDSYYLYKSIFTEDTVLHILPHWNWTPGQKIDVHVYFNHADEIELFVNGNSIGKKSKENDDIFVRFNRLTYQPGNVKAVAYLKGKKIKETTTFTAGEPYQIIAGAEKGTVTADGDDLDFIRVSIVDRNGNLVPDAKALLKFDISGAGTIAALDNGSQTDLEPYTNKTTRRAFNGLALAIVRPETTPGEIVLKISSENLIGASVKIKVK